jgi:hypothetical protein
LWQTFFLLPSADPFDRFGGRDDGNALEACERQQIGMVMINSTLAAIASAST